MGWQKSRSGFGREDDPFVHLTSLDSNITAGNIIDEKLHQEPSPEDFGESSIGVADLRVCPYEFHLAYIACESNLPALFSSVTNSPHSRFPPQLFIISASTEWA